MANPGSDKALKEGCRCPVLDNGHGWGYIVEGQFVMSGDCPLHGASVKAAVDLFEYDRKAQS